MKGDLIIGIDCSTSSCKAIIWDRNGKKVAQGRSDLNISTPKPLWHEQSADKWWQATVVALKTALRQINSDRIAGICIAHQRETFVPVDGDGKPLRDAILWMDERANDQLGYLDKAFGREQFHALTGKPLSGNLSVAKICWLQQNEPDIFKKTSKFLDVHAFLVYKLTNQFYTSWGSADPMGLFDMLHNQWALSLLESINLSQEQFPVAISPGKIIGEITSDASKECGLPVGVPIIAGIGDGQSAGLGSNITTAGISYLSLGTSVVSGYFTPYYQISRNFRTMYGGIDNSYYLETVILSGTYTITWLLEKVLHNKKQDSMNYHLAQKDLEGEAKKIPEGANGLLLVPYWNSSMNPYWDSKASGLMIGLRSIHNRSHIYRAILEGIAFEQRLHINGVESVLGCELEKIIVVGGGANSDFWCQIISDITGKRLQRPVEREATALGAGILAASASDFYSNPREAAQAMVHLEDRVFEPDKNRHNNYSILYDNVYQHIYPALRDRLRHLTQYNVDK